MQKGCKWRFFRTIPAEGISSKYLHNPTEEGTALLIKKPILLTMKENKNSNRLNEIELMRPRGAATAYEINYLFSVKQSISCITFAPSSALHGLEPSSKKYSTTFSIIGC